MTEIEGFTTGAFIVTIVFICMLITVVATIGTLLFRHADRHGEGVRDPIEPELAAPIEDAAPPSTAPTADTGHSAPTPIA